MGQTFPPHIKICLVCKNYLGTKLFGEKGVEQDQVNICSAFSNDEGIPNEILLGDNLHKKPLQNQENDIIFEK